MSSASSPAWLPAPAAVRAVIGEVRHHLPQRQAEGLAARVVKCDHLDQVLFRLRAEKGTHLGLQLCPTLIQSF